MPSTLPPIPLKSYPVEGIQKPMSRDWILWFFQFIERIQAGARLIQAVHLGPPATTAQSASIPATSLGVSDAGTYEVSWTLRVTQPASSSSSLQVTIGYSDQGEPVTQVGASVTGNTVTTVQSGLFTIDSDAASPVTYAVAYTSSGATPMQYKISVICKQVAS